MLTKHNSKTIYSHLHGKDLRVGNLDVIITDWEKQTGMTLNEENLMLFLTHLDEFGKNYGELLRYIVVSKIEERKVGHSG